MIYQRIKWSLVLIHLSLILFIAEFFVAAVTLTPVDYLLPPPPSPPSPPAVPITVPAVVRFTNNPNSKKLLTPKHTEPPPGIINRVARWFGYANNAQNKWPDFTSSADNSKQSIIYYDKPHGKQQTIDAILSKKNCNICNKYPWMPMFHNSHKWTPQAQQSLITLRTEKAHDVTEPHHGTSKIKQRAVQYYGPQINLLNVGPSDYKQPSQSQYNYESLETATTVSGITSIQPQTQYASVTKEIYSASTEQSLKSFNNDDDVEIIKSKEIAEYLSSVEHPVTVIQSQAIDVNVSAHITLPSNHKIVSNDNEIFYNNHYQQDIFEANENRPIGPTEIIRETENVLNGLDDVQEHYHSPPIISIYENVTPSYKYLPTYPFNSDNLLAASSKNDSIVESTSIPTTTITTKTTAGAAAAAADSSTTITKSNDYHYTTIVSKINSAEDLKTQWLLGSLQDYRSKEYRKNRLKNFLANIQVPGPQHQQHQQQYQYQVQRPRETPKNLLNAPIQYISKGLMDIPRPFTKDPAKLGFHNKMKNHFITSTTIKPYFLMNHNGGNGNNMLQAYLTHTLPTPTSTYGAIDASGYYANISPPPLPLNREQALQSTRQPILSQSTPQFVSSMSITRADANLHRPTKKYVLPIEIKTQPRPFKTLKESAPYNLELLPEESMLFDVKSQETSILGDRTNWHNKSKIQAKYLTKILAHNLRELLKREHEQPSDSQTNAISFDLIKLQNNIDEWIEQEYNSPSHRASTPTLRGRSKHIPIEYVEMLAATTMKTLKRQGKTFKNSNGNNKDNDNDQDNDNYKDNPKQGYTLSISVNSLEPIYSTITAATMLHDNWNEKYKYNAITVNQTNSDNGNSEIEESVTNSTNDTTYMYVTVQETDNELWRKAAITVLPETQEKLYVVTPQTTMVTKKMDSPLKILKDMFITPRFSIRPTIKSNIYTESSQTQTEPFGLKGLTTYVHNQPIKIIDGNSKVVMIVTPSMNEESSATTPTTPTTPTTGNGNGVMDLTKMKHTTIKPTLSPTSR